ncbi:MAG: hypothetical protein KDA97_07605 [Acidimicrobiales bacterium]|nr:hypothetical protein [Acidimicrobiales bacterium]
MLADRELTPDATVPSTPATRLELLGDAAAVGPDERTPLDDPAARLVLAFLVLSRDRAVTRDELAEVLWLQELPPRWSATLRTVLGRLRRFLDGTGLGRGGEATVAYQEGTYRLGLRPEVVVDVEVALAALEDAELRLSRGEVDQVLDPAGHAAGLLADPLLAGDPSAWLDQQRDRLRFLRVRALHLAGIALVAEHRHGPAIDVAAEALSLDPRDEAANQALMVAHLAAGDPDAAIAAYERCRRQLADVVGRTPGPGLDALHRRALALAQRDADPAPPTGAWAAPGTDRIPDADAPWRAACDEGRHARARFDYEVAADAFEAALDLAATAPAAERARIRVQLGGARRRQGRYPEARSLLEEALVAAREAGDAEVVALAVLELVGGGGRGVAPDLDHPERAALLDEALAGLGAGPLRLRTSVMAELALALQLVDPDRSRVLAAAAHDLARASGEVDDRARAMVATRLTKMLPADADARLRASDQVIGARNHQLPGELRARLLMWRLYDHAELADRAGFEHDLAELDALTARLGQPYWRWISAGWGVTQAALDGDLDEAERRADASIALMAGTDHPEVAESWGAHLLGIRILQGRGGELVEPLRALADDRPAIPAYRAGLALALAQGGRHDEAAAELTAFCRPDGIRVQRDTNWSGTLGALAAATAEVGHERLANDLLRLLEPHGERMVMLSLYGGGGIYFGPVALHLGRLAALTGRYADARVWLAHAQLRADRFGADGFAEAAGTTAAALPHPDA